MKKGYEIAKQYLIKKYGNDFVDFIETEGQSYLDGYEKGYEDCRHYAHDYYKPKWHDLRVNPEDVPMGTGEYWVLDEDGDYSVFNVYVNELPLALFDNINAVAWLELPKFEEKA